MSFASTSLCILFAVNLLVFLVGNSEMNSPMLGLLKALAEGGFSDIGPVVSYALSWEFISQLAGKFLIVGAIAGIMIVLSPPLLGGGYGAIHIPLLFAMIMAITLFLIPNFSAMGFPFPLDMIIYSLFGLGWVLSIFGLLRGE